MPLNRSDQAELPSLLRPTPEKPRYLRPHQKSSIKFVATKDQLEQIHECAKLHKSSDSQTRTRLSTSSQPHDVQAINSDTSKSKKM